MTKEEYIQEITVHKAMMYRIAFTILQNDSDVQDALQEAALKAWESSTRSETKRSSPRG